MLCSYPSLVVLPGIAVDERGNLRFENETGEGLGPRGRQDRVMAMPVAALTGTILAELLNWFRWGAPEGVLWECTVGELLQVIERWEQANPNATLAQYYRYPVTGKLTTWAEVWRHARASEASRVRVCACGNVYNYYSCACDVCQRFSADARLTFKTHRGLDTYKTALIGGDGGCVAVAAFTSRGTKRIVPELAWELG